MQVRTVMVTPAMADMRETKEHPRALAGTVLGGAC